MSVPYVIQNLTQSHLFSEAMNQRDCVYIHFILLALMLLKTQGVIGMEKNDDCLLENSNVVCENRIPFVVPSNISGIVIRDYLNYIEDICLVQC
jgi:hypothetical protein